MVGQEIAVYLSIEVKGEHGRATKEQKQWLEIVKKAGGLAGIAKSVEDAEKIIFGVDLKAHKD